ncbi:MAG: exodeoxyribonuclease V subunit gamma [Thermodesulfobacteriota bacterium]
MAGLVIHTGNRLELLVKQLARDISAPRLSVFEPEIVITQSPGMSRWVSMQLAACQRVSANLDFPYPNTFLNLLCEALSLVVPTTDDPFDPVNMTFAIMNKLPSCLSRKGYEGLKNYFHEDRRPIKLLQLSHRIAHLFDQYLVFRPEMILNWDEKKEGKGDQVWQADLWREIALGNAHLHRVRRHVDLVGTLANDSAVSDALPERVSVFGISYLPEFHLQILSALSNRIPVNWYFLSPCRQYWGEVVSERDISRIREKYAYGPSGQADLHLDKGNPLLASMGALGRDFISMIAEAGCDLQEHYVPPGRDSLLNSIQADILDMLDAAETRKRGMGNSDHEWASHRFGADGSIEIHACHSAMREIEVLHDNLLDMFHHIPDLKPRDILVMTPDIDTYAPFIQAVFEKYTGHPSEIPFSLADNSALYQSRILEAFFALLSLPGSRMEVDKITGLLEYAPVRKRFGLEDQDVAVIERWVKELNIRWGFDGADRRDADLPAFTENTWKNGLDRLLLGYAMSGRDSKLFSGLLPHDDVEGDQGRVLGSFLDYFAWILKSVKLLEAPKSLQSWSSGLQGIVDGIFFKDNDSEQELQALKHLLSRLQKVQEITGFEDDLDLEAVAFQLKSELEHASFGSGFLAGKVTFCAMLPMRSIPFKVICLLGMNGDAFPRDDNAPGFDLMATHPSRGDRSRRNDDKYLFLEALMSARKKLYISYMGKDIQDNSPLTPSVMVSELIDYAQHGYGLTEKGLVRQHPLQAFSAHYFKEKANLFSYAEENFAAAVAAQQPPVKPEKKPALPEPPAVFKHLEVETLAAFYTNPLKYFLNTRLGIYLEKEEEILETSENFRLGGLERYKAGLELFQADREARQPEELMTLFKARGMLPPCRVGEHDFTEMSLEAEELVARMHTWTLKREPREQPINLQVGDFIIRGFVSDVYDHAMVHTRFARFNPRDLVRCWIAHLQLCAGTVPKGRPRQSVYLCKNISGVFSPLDNSSDVLEYLLQLYWQGLSCPLPFYTKTAYEYARARLIQEKPKKAALKAAYGILRGNRYYPGEIEEPYMNFYFDAPVSLDEMFEQTALTLFKPLFEHYTSSTVSPTLQLKDTKHL